MANLGLEQTGIDGTICISTSEGEHGPCIKYFEHYPGASWPFVSYQISSYPRVIDGTLEISSVIDSQIKEWIVKNEKELLNFWYDGTTWMNDDVQEFIGKLKKVEYKKRDRRLLMKIDTDGTITYGKDDTEHLLSSPAMRERILSAIKDIDAGKPMVMMITNPETGEMEFYKDTGP